MQKGDVGWGRGSEGMQSGGVGCGRRGVGAKRRDSDAVFHGIRK